MHPASSQNGNSQRSAISLAEERFVSELLKAAAGARLDFRIRCRLRACRCRSAAIAQRLQWRANAPLVSPLQVAWALNSTIRQCVPPAPDAGVCTIARACGHEAIFFGRRILQYSRLLRWSIELQLLRLLARPSTARPDDPNERVSARRRTEDLRPFAGCAWPHPATVLRVANGHRDSSRAQRMTTTAQTLNPKPHRSRTPIALLPAKFARLTDDKAVSQ